MFSAVRILHGLFQVHVYVVYYCMGQEAELLIFNQEKTNRKQEKVDLELMEVYNNFIFVFTLSSTTPEFDFTLHWPQVHCRLVCTVAGISVLGVLIFLPSSLKEEAVQGAWMVQGGCDQVQQGGSVTAWVSRGCAYIHTQT